MQTARPTQDMSSLGAIFVKMFKAGGAAAEKIAARFDPLPATPKPDPELLPHHRDALSQIEEISPVVATLSLGAMRGRAGYPSVPARVEIIGPAGSRMLPAALWEELIAGGWINTAGRLSAQYHRVTAAELEP